MFKSWLHIGTLLLLPSLLQAQDFSILTRQGDPLSEDQHHVDVQMHTLEERDGIRTIEYQLTSRVDEPQFYQLRSSVSLAGSDLQIFDGLNHLEAGVKKHRIRMLYLGCFPLAAVWDGKQGLAVASGAEDHHSFLYLDMQRTNAQVTLTQTVNAALPHKGAVYRGRFHLIRFSPKYQERDAMARYYQLYPRRFFRNPQVDPRLYGISAAYNSWWSTHAERVRVSGADWEWCIHASRHWGDLVGDYFDLSHERYIEPIYRHWRNGVRAVVNLPGIDKPTFLEVIRERFANGYYTGVANAFYTTGASRIHKDLGKRFEDSLATDHPVVIDHGYDYAASVFAFPETSWGQELMRMIRIVAERHDLGAMAFDIPLESEVYRGERLVEMENIGFDQHGPGIVRAVANSRLYQQINQVPTRHGDYRMGVVINANTMHQINDCFYADMSMAEANPWQYAPPWPRALRYAMGEKGVTFWEGFHPTEFDTNFHQDWSQEEKHQFYRDLGRYTAHRAFLLGIGYPAHFSIHSDYLARLVPSLRACLDAGYRVVPGSRSHDEEITLTRYGNGEAGLLAICNLSQDVRQPEIEIFPSEFRDDRVLDAEQATPLLFASRLGSSARNRYADERSYLTAPIAPLRLNVLEVIGTLPMGALGDIETVWSRGGFETIELTLASRTYTGSIQIREWIGNYHLNGPAVHTLTPGQTLRLTFRHRNAGISDSLIAQMPLLDDAHQPQFTLHVGATHESREMGERIEAFFRELGRSRQSDFSLQMAVRENAALPPFAVALSLNDQLPAVSPNTIGGDANNLFVVADDRESFSVLTRRMLDVLNRLQYPDYILGAPMRAEDRAIFLTERF